MEKYIRGRFAPSPTGRMHAGNALCALLAWLAVRQSGGKMVLRIEDIDPDRCRPAYADRLMRDLVWLGLDWDEGGEKGGPFSPYLQSECTEIYQEAFSRLKDAGLVYPCFCSRGELHAASAPHPGEGGSVYSGRCRGLTPAQAAARAAVRRPAWRIRVPDEEIVFTDGCRGEYGERLAEQCGDFILRRSDGVFAYQLAVVVDDGRMGITQVVRGNDLLSSTPRQLYLYRLLGLKPPEFFHIPLLAAADGRRLSKRDADLDLGCLQERFRDPQPVVGRLAFLCGLIDRDEPIQARELIPEFSFEKLRAAGPVICLQEDEKLFGGREGALSWRKR